MAAPAAATATAFSSPLFPLLLRCAEQRSLRPGMSLHARVIKTGFWSNTFLANGVLNMYAKCARLPDAAAAFDDMPLRDAVTWNSLINAQAHHPAAVLRLFRDMMRAEGAARPFPNAFTFSGVFTAVANAGSGCSGGAEAHCVAIKTANCDDVFVGSSLVSMYCKLGLLSNARRVFDRMPDRNSVSWAAMISGYASEKRGDEAFSLFRAMLEEGQTECDGSEFVFTSVLSALCLPTFHAKGQEIHAVAIKNGLASLVSVGNSLVTFYAKCERMDDAQMMFKSSGDKNTITWSAMITGCAQNGESSRALTFFSQMQREGLRPTEFTFVGVLNASSDLIALVEGRQAHGYLLKVGFEHQIYSRSALIDMYAKCGCIDDARKLFGQLDEADVVIWTAMIGGYVQNGEHEEALSLYGRMEKEGILPNDLTVTSVLRACSSLAGLEQGKQIQARALKHGFGLGIPIGSALSTMYAKCGLLEDCIRAFRRMPKRDVVAWNSIISGFAQNGRGKDALDLFEEMRTEGVEPNHITFINVLNACSHMGLVERGWGYFRSMCKDHGLDPRVEHYACMVDMLTRAGMFKDAKEFVESVPDDQRMCLWRIILGACRNFRDFEIGAYAGERVIELGSSESSAYTLLSNIYAAWNRWNDVERVRRTMRLRGVNKEPGCSWIELKNRVHVFVVGEQLHPETEKLYLEVKQLTKHMKDEGYRPAVGSHFQNLSEIEQESHDEEELQLTASFVT